MNRELKQPFELVVIGGGPAGLAAAVRAAECGAGVAIVDDNRALGGQVWREDSERTYIKEAEDWRRRAARAGVTALFGMRVFQTPEPGVLFAESADGFCQLGYKTVVLATGARERFLPFPGWTLPNVMGAGGLQALVKSGLPIRNKRVVVAGSGPLLLAVADYVNHHGEQTSRAALARFGFALLGQPQKLTQAVQLKWQLTGVPFVTNAWPTAANGE